MLRRLLLVLALAMIGMGALAQQGDPGICEGSAEVPCDSNRPWMRGRTEKSCARGGLVETLRRESPGRIILECACEHKCAPGDKYAGETNKRAWDGLCAARCSPANCKCPHPCQTT